MSSIADSNAILDNERQLGQHQAVITLLQGILADPGLANFYWLDLACGKGQIINHLDLNLPAESRLKLSYFGYDLKSDYAKIAERRASSLGLKYFKFEIGDLLNFPKIFKSEIKFDLITITNTVHEMDPNTLASVFFYSLQRLKDKGELFIYDMNSLESPELGAITWEESEMKEIFTHFLKLFDQKNSPPVCGTWRHSSCKGWNVRINRAFYKFNGNVLDDPKEAEKIIANAGDKILEVIKRKLELVRAALDSLTICGAESINERSEIQTKLFEFWSLSRSLEIKK